GRVLTRLPPRRSLVGRVLTRLPLRQSPVGRVLTRRSFADIKIKGFRAVTARATFLCLCKETWRKETHPACAPGALHRVRGAGGIFRADILSARKTPHIHVRRPCGVLSADSAAPEGPRHQDQRPRQAPPRRR